MLYRSFFIFLMLGMAFPALPKAQNIYLDSAETFRRNYIANHEIVTGKDKDYLDFFPIDKTYLVKCRFEKSRDPSWFEMSTSGTIKQTYRKYGTLHFSIHDTSLQLTVYQSQALMNNAEYKDYLFIPFTDATSGVESYGAGRYLECYIQNLKNNMLELDFNKAYNPYCAYTTGYNCPLPPKENQLAVSIRAGEKIFKKAH